jgi:hypothetical protein
MSIYERLNGLSEGEPGAVVDEDLSETNRSYLYYAYYDENGCLMYYSDFERDASPEEISEQLNDFANNLLHSYQEGMTLEDIIEKVDELREQARNVPGLGIK